MISVKNESDLSTSLFMAAGWVGIPQWLKISNKDFGPNFLLSTNHIKYLKILKVIQFDRK